jgi:hypothetical protein
LVRSVKEMKAQRNTWAAVIAGMTWLAFAAVASAEPASPESEAFVLGPPARGEPVIVTTRFIMRDINDIDDASERFEFGGMLELSWKDERQAFDPVAEGIEEKVYQGTFQFSEIDPAWYPQVVLLNESGLFDIHGVFLHVAPDGTSRLVQTINAAAEVDLDLHRYPFDRHRLEAVFVVLGSLGDEVQLRTDQAPMQRSEHRVKIPQWEIQEISAETRDGELGRSRFVLSVEAEREPFFAIRLVVIPLLFIVMLSWSVFWMEGSSLADRLGISFIGILTAVAYQIVVSDIQPDIAYMTLMHGFLNLSFFLMCATVPVVLLVGWFERRGDAGRARSVDRRSRIVFPTVYFGLTLVMVMVAFVFF